MSGINPAAVIKVVSREIFQKYGDNDIEPTGDDLTFACLLYKMISQKFRGEQYTIKPSAAGVTPPTHAITGMPPPIIPGVVNPHAWRAPVPNLAMQMPHSIPAVISTGLVPTNTLAATPAAKLNRPMISEQDIQRRAFMNQVCAELRDEAYNWQEYKTPDNKLYYYHSKTKEKTWTKPDIIIKLDEEIAVIRELKSKHNKPSTSPSHSQTRYQNSPLTDDSNAHNRSNSSSNRFVKNNTNDNNPQHDNDNIHNNNSNNNNDENGNSSNDRNDSKTTARGANNTTTSSGSSMKPVSTAAIPGTTWCVVWTDKQRVFYFNQSTKTSVWERPAELKFREDVDAIVRGDDVTSRNNSGKRSDSDEPNTLSYSLKRMKQ